ncbi:unnamed protein product [Penicillium glandicola]
MPAIPKEKMEASASLTDPTYAKQVKDLFNVNSSESTGTVSTKKRKRRARSEAKRLRMSSSMETISPESIHSETSHKHSSNKEAKRDNTAIKSAMSRGMQKSPSPERTQLEREYKLSDQKAMKDTASIKPATPFPPTPYNPALRALSQYNQHVWSQCGSACETWLARQMYHELDDISTRIEEIMHGIRVLLEKRGARDDFEGLGDDHFEAEEAHGEFKGCGPENPLELSDEEDNALFMSSDELSCSESSGLSGDE